MVCRKCWLHIAKAKLPDCCLYFLNIGTLCQPHDYALSLVLRCASGGICLLLARATRTEGNLAER